jgi:cytochrome c biogenesis protein CcdA
MYTVWTYIIYLIISTALTVWVARTLSRGGRIFLVEAFGGKEDLADSVNHLLVVGFYLVNIGYVTLALSYGTKPYDVQSAIEFLSWKIGLVLVVLGFMHFLNIAVFSDMRKKARLEAARSTAAPREPNPGVIA